ncbi:hypothetical protein [Dasania marina]|uniref:hypothetical protein n=1 Tax=Dasania marina TaxID=471499 RepID=UPI0030DCE965
MAYLASLAALLFYGGWALWLNLDAGNTNAYFPALCHGLYAGLLTWLMHNIVVAVHRRASPLTRYPAVTAWFVASVLSFIVPLLVQSATGGVRPLATIAPGFLIGQIYIIGLLYVHRPGPSQGHTAN